ncbi:MAG: hypothetical protein WCH39_17465 [Schlesneria sp.]
MRLCLVYYFERQINLDHESTNTEPERQQIVLAKRVEFPRTRSSAVCHLPVYDRGYVRTMEAACAID